MDNLKKKLTFDLYGRYQSVKDIIDANRHQGKVFRILDVGGRGNILRRFLPDDKVFYLDPLVDTDDNNFIQGDGCDIQLKDESFDFVISCDVFEHISIDKRERFISENIRVAKLGVVLTAPFYGKELELAEKQVNDEFKKLFGKNHPWLIEHSTNGLPKAEELQDWLKEKRLKYEIFYNNYLPVWLNAINFRQILELDPVANKKIIEDFNFFYNSQIYKNDNIQPAYRSIYFIKKVPGLISIEHPKPFSGLDLFVTLNNFIWDCISSRTKNWHKKIIDLETHNSEMIQKIENSNYHIQTQAEQINRLVTTNQAILQSKTWRLSQTVYHIFPSLFRTITYIYKNLPVLVQLSIIRIKKEGIIKTVKRIGEFFIWLFKEKPPILNTVEYNRWLSKNRITANRRNQMKKDIVRLTIKPTITIVMPVYKTNEVWLRKAVESVRNQIYSNWELCIVDDGSRKRVIQIMLRQFSINDPRIKVKFLNRNEGIDQASNRAIRMGSGEFVAFLDHDDELTEDALYQVVKVINQYPKTDFIYTDEDKMSPDGKLIDPFFKPDWSPYSFYSYMYVTHLRVFKRSILNKIGLISNNYPGSGDYDLVLRIMERTDKISHIPKICYHWRQADSSVALNPETKYYAFNNAKRALEDHFKRLGRDIRVEDGSFLGSYRIRWKHNNPLVSIIIPFKNQVHLLTKCLDGLVYKTNFQNIEIILIDNGSNINQKHKLNKYINEIKDKIVINKINDDSEFNFSKLCNVGAKKAKGEYLLFLNSDISVTKSFWLDALVEIVVDPSVGIVGGKLLYPNKTIQHAGITLGIGFIAGHPGRFYPYNHPGHVGNLLIIRDVSAVTGACLLIRKKLFVKVKGFDEKNLPIAYNDVDLCLRCRERGYNIVWTPYCELIHNESASRKKTSDGGMKKDRKEILYMKQRWGEKLNNDPFYNPNLTRSSEDFSLNL